MKKLEKFQIEEIHRKISFSLVIFGILILIFVLSFGLKISRSVFEKNDGSAQDIVTIKGIFECLPLKEANPNKTEKCKYGIRTSNGDYYAISEVTPLSVYNKVGIQGMEISGVIIPPEPNEKYNIKGTIVEK